MDALCLSYLSALVSLHDAHSRRCRSVGWLVVGTDPHVCLLSNPAQCASSTCLALDTDGQRLLALLAWHLPGQTRRMLLAFHVLGNRCDLWLSALCRQGTNDHLLLTERG